jgi:hypothetical protein
MAKKSSGRSSQQRDRVKSKGGARYAKRKSDGTFREMDDVGRSQTADRRTKAKRTVRSGYGDQGDRKTSTKSTKSTRTRKAAAKKR